MRFVGEAGSNGSADVLFCTASDRMDPGYGSTATMLGEAALCLALEPLKLRREECSPRPWRWAACSWARLRRAGLTFEVAG